MPLKRIADLVPDLQRCLFPLPNRSVVQAQSVTIGGRLRVLHVEERVSPNVMASLTGGFNLVADLGDASGAAASEVLPTDDACAFEFSESPVEQVTISGFRPGQLSFAMRGDCGTGQFLSQWTKERFVMVALEN
jgi:hypothetical protein